MSPKNIRPLERFKDYLRQWWYGRGSLKSETFPNLLRAEEFEDNIRQEKGRSDRSGLPFTLLSFAVTETESDPSTNHKCLRLLADIIQNRTRVTDIKGLHGMGGKQIGVILTNTIYEDALIPVQAIEKKFYELAKAIISSQIPEISCEIFTYPSYSQEKTMIHVVRYDTLANGLRERSSSPPASVPVNSNG